MVMNEKYPESLISAFLTHWKPKEIMTAAQISKSKYYKLVHDPTFQKILTDRRGEVIRDAVRQMESYLTTDIEILQSIITDENTSPQIKINAIGLLLNQLNQWKATTEILDRLTKLEDAQSQNKAF